MAKNLICIAFLITILNGCGKSEVSVSPATADAAATVVPQPTTTPPTAPLSPKPAVNAAPLTPPGTIEMPAGVLVEENAPPPPSDPIQKKGGFEMPPTGLDNAPVMVKRPVLDEVVTTADADTEEITLTAATLEEIQATVAKAGKVCVVDYWSLACEPCLKEFPGLVRLNKALADKVTCLSVNVDYDGRKSKPAETYRPRVEAFLQSTGATFQNFLCLTPNEDVYAELKIVSIPAVLVYDASGKLVRTFTDTGDDVGFTYAKDIAPLVQSLVAN
jgi:thiol-disulfide isomerase/thioredoxin